MSSNVDDYFSELKWLAMKAGIKPGWAYYQFKEHYGREPTEAERNQKPIVPNENLIILSRGLMSDYRYQRLLRAYEWAKMPEEEKAKIVNERKQARKFKARAYQALDAHRPKLNDL